MMYRLGHRSARWVPRPIDGDEAMTFSVDFEQLISFFQIFDDTVL